MARTEVPIVVLNVEGQPVVGASVQIKHRASGLNANWYTSEASGTASTAAVITDSLGRTQAWVDRGAYTADITGTGITPYSEAFDSTPAADGGIDVAQLSAAILDKFIPIGASLEWEGASDPTGGNFLIENGRAVSRTTYATLFAILGTKHGAGDGSTTFNLPDSRGRVVVGMGTHAEVDTIGENDGLAVGSRRIKHSHGDGTLAVVSHTHSDGTLAAAAHAHFYGFTLNTSSAQNPSDPAYWAVVADATGGVQEVVPGWDHYHQVASGLLATQSATADVTGATGATAPDVTGTTAESGFSFIVKNKIIRVL
jgi:microcystin-dependent protein